MRTSRATLIEASVLLVAAATMVMTPTSATAAPNPKPPPAATTRVVHLSSSSTTTLLVHRKAAPGQTAAATSFSCPMVSHVTTDATYSVFLFWHTLQYTDTTFSTEVDCTQPVASSMSIVSLLKFKGNTAAQAPYEFCDSSPTAPTCKTLLATGGPWHCGGTGCAGTYQTQGAIIVQLGTYWAWSNPLPGNCSYQDPADKKILCSVYSNAVTVSS